MGISELPTLVFLHGVGEGNPADELKKALNSPLQELGYPSIETVNMCVPVYAHALLGNDDVQKIPPLTVTKQNQETIRKHRRTVEAATSGLELKIGQHSNKKGAVIPELAFGMSVNVPALEQVKKYVTDEKVRAGVLKRILDVIPKQGKIVLVGHSLGSVIAADLLLRLPVAVTVTGVITIGSPLGQGFFQDPSLQKLLANPPQNTGWWCNLRDPKDPIAWTRSLAVRIPWVLDVAVHTGKNLIKAHYATSYLSHKSVALAIGSGLFGSVAQELEAAYSTDEEMTETEITSLVILSYAHHVLSGLKGETQERYAGALRQVQLGMLQRLEAENYQRNTNLAHPRLLPRRISRLEFDPLDISATLPVPLVPQTTDREFASKILIGIVLQNVMSPFEIDVPKNVIEESLKAISNELGLKSVFGADVLKSIAQAESVLKGTSLKPWVKAGTIGAGVIAITLATGGLALAIGGVGLAGAAAITSGLAIFGPGGMIGGIITAGSLVSLGSGSLAAGILSPGTSSEEVESWLIQILSLAIMHDDRAVNDERVCFVLIEIESQLRREHERLDEYSDPKSSTLASLKKKLNYLGRAIAFLSPESALEELIV